MSLMLAPRARLRQSFSRTLRSQKHNVFFNGSKAYAPSGILSFFHWSVVLYLQ
jgi:hypothetical protein